jgi:hypothetical protein
LANPAFSLERELAGVELGQRALELLSNPKFGTPDYIGPVGSLGAIPPPAATNLVGQFPGMVGSAGTAGTTGQPGAPAAPSGPTTSAMSALMDIGIMPGMAGMPGAAAGATGQPGASAAPGGTTAGMTGMGPGAAATGAGSAPTAIEAVWMYQRGNARILVTVDEDGRVTNVALQGKGPSRVGRTLYNLGLDASPGMIFATYGLPDRTVALTNGLEYTYLDHGVRFTLEDFRTTEIMIGQRVSEAAAVIVAREKKAKVQPKVAPGPGLSLEALKGYM